MVEPPPQKTEIERAKNMNLLHKMSYWLYEYFMLNLGKIKFFLKMICADIFLRCLQS